MNYGCLSRGKNTKSISLIMRILNRSKNQFLLHSIPEPTPSTMTALHQFGAEMLKLSRGLQSFAPVTESSDDKTREIENEDNFDTSKHHKVNVEWYVNRHKKALISF